MKKVLLLHNAENVDVLGSVPATKEWVEKHIRDNHGLNIGNKVFVTACEQYLTKPDINYECYPFYKLNPEETKGKYDYIVAPLANIFNNGGREFLKALSDWIKMVETPVFVIGCGIQCNKDNEIYTIKESIGDVTAEFIDNIYDRGGAVSTRGWLTKEYLDMCLDNNAVATGCPSFYRGGSEFSINLKDIGVEDFSVVCTSTDLPSTVYSHNIKKYPGSIIIDQGLIPTLFFDSHNKRIFISKIEAELGIDFVHYLINNKVYMPLDITKWQECIRKRSFAVGSRIHGCITAMQTGLPTKVIMIDSRTRELADYIGLPRVEQINKETDLYDEYTGLDFNEFNRKYKEGFEHFNKFILDNRISYDIDDHLLWDEKIKDIHWLEEEIIDSATREKLKKFTGWGSRLIGRIERAIN